jgi:hypothetical protein
MQLIEQNLRFVSVVLTLWLAMAGLSKRACMDDMVIERELYMDSDSEEEICIDDETGNLPPPQEPSPGYEDSADEEQVEPEDGTWQTGSNRCGRCSAIHWSNTWIGNSKYYMQFHPLATANAILHLLKKPTGIALSIMILKEPG